MKAEDLFEALTDIDEKMVADAKPVMDAVEAQKGVRLAPVKRSPWKTLAAAAAGVAIIGTAGGVVAANFDKISAAFNPVYRQSALYPEDAKYQYKGDYTELEAGYPFGIVTRETHFDLDWLIENSDLAVVGTFLDDPYQNVNPKKWPEESDVEVRTLEDGSFYTNRPYRSYNRLKIDKVLNAKEDFANVSLNQEIIVQSAHAVQQDALWYLEDSRPMIKGDTWVYFLIQSEDGYFYTLSGDEGKFKYPDRSSEVSISNTTNAISESEAYARLYDEVMEYAGDLGAVYPEWAQHQYLGNFSELTPHIGGVQPDNVYDDLDSLMAASDLVVVGTFLDDAYQDWDPSLDIDRLEKKGQILLISMSANRFKIDEVLYVGDDAEPVNVGDDIIIAQHYDIVGGYFRSAVNSLTPMLKGDRWIYFLRDVRDTSIGAYIPTVGDTSSRYPVPDHKNKPFYFSDNDYGVFDMQYFCEDIYEEVLEQLYSKKVERIYDSFIQPEVYPGFTAEFTMEEFPDARFTASPMDGITDGSGVYPTILPLSYIESLYLTDLNGDGYRELCTVDSIPRYHYTIRVYDLYNGTDYLLYVNNSCAWRLRAEKGTLMAVRHGAGYDNSLIGDEIEAMPLTMDMLSKQQNNVPDGVEVIFDNYGLENPQWVYDKTFTMPEFPGEMFNWSSDMYPSLNVFLVDLDGDGYREVCRTVRTFEDSDSDIIEVRSYHTKFGFDLSDREHGFHLLLENGVLYAVETFGGKEVSFKPLKDYVGNSQQPSMADAAPVKNYFKASENSASWNKDDCYYAYEYETEFLEPVYSTVDGTVIISDLWDIAAEYLYIVSNTDGKIYTYGPMGIHKDTGAMQTGDRVRVGQPIGISPGTVRVLCSATPPYTDLTERTMQIFGGGLMFYMEYTNHSEQVGTKTYRIGSNIEMIARIKNNTDSPITLYRGSLHYDNPRYVTIDFANGDSHLVDPAEYGMAFDAAIETFTLQPGEEYTQALTIETNAANYSDFSKTPAPAGQYLGAATVMVRTDDGIETYTMNVDLKLVK